MMVNGAARGAALQALRKVQRGAPVSEALRQSRRLTGPDRALTTQLVYGVLRHRRYLDAWIDSFRRGRLDPDVREILRLAFFQIGFLDRIPDYAVVDAAVEQAKAVNRGAAGLVNAILRRGSAHAPAVDQLPLAVRYSHPDWIVSRWEKRYGNRLEEILAADQEIAPLILRVDLSRTRREAVVEQLQNLGAKPVPSSYLPEAIRVPGPLWLEDLPAFRDGLVTVQDESGMLVNWILDAQPGDAVLDMAAGVGGKAIHALERTAGGIRLTAVDLSRARLHQFEENLARTGYGSPAVVTVIESSGQAYAAAHVNQFDRVILDAPCSGLGVLRRRVDARWGKSPDAFTALADRQTDLLKAAVSAAGPDGVVVYSTCSTEPEETLAVIDNVSPWGWMGFSSHG
jgi:16S rRNA (cytosine967-C5)-methyltransferase